MLLLYNTHVRLPLKGHCGWQVRRTQALTVLLALVRADLGTSTLDTLQSSGLLGSLLQDLTNNARADLLQACLNPESSTPAFVLHEDILSGPCTQEGSWPGVPGSGIVHARATWISQLKPIQSALLGRKTFYSKGHLPWPARPGKYCAAVCT